MVFTSSMLSIPGLLLCCFRRCISHYLRGKKGLEKPIRMNKEFLLHLHTKPTKENKCECHTTFLRASMGHCTPLQNWKKRKKKREPLKKA